MDAVAIALEVAVPDAAGVRIAAEVGAARVELAQALALGGLTPSLGAVEAALQAAADQGAGPEVHVLIRPRAGGFRYDADEVAVMVRDIRQVVALGAAGVVVGALDERGRLDENAMTALRDAASGASVTLHRAIDVSADPLETLRTARALGVRRVLTSGAASAAIDGTDVLRSLVAEAAGAIEIMAGGGVTAANAAVLAGTGVDALHFSAKRLVTEDGGVRLGSAADGAGGHEVTDRATALAVRAAVGY